MLDPKRRPPVHAQDPAAQTASISPAGTKPVLFTVTSALNASPRHSRFSNAERLAQTQGTVSSIRDFYNDAQIVIIDGSVEQPGPQIVASLGPDVTFTWMGHLPGLKEIASGDNFNVVKNISEMVIYSQFLADLLRRNAHRAYRRIFKISGRYRLNANFRASLHDSPEALSRFVFSRRTRAAWNPAHVGTMYAFQTRLFSFDPNLAYLLTNLYFVALQDVQDKLAAGIYTDLEHSMGRFLNPNLVFEVDRIGVTGDIGSFIMQVDE